MNHQRFSFRGYLFVIIAVTFWGGSASLAKYLFNTRFDALTITQTRVSLSFLLLAGYFLIADRSVFKIDLKDVPKFAAVGIFGIAATNFTYYFTVKESTVATAILVQSTAPVFVMLYAVFISREEGLNKVKVIALLLSLIGCYLAVSGGSFSDIHLKGWAILTAPASAASYTIVILGTKHLSNKYSSWTTLIYLFGFVLLFWLCINPPQNIIAHNFTAGDWGMLWLFAIVSVLIPQSFFTSSMKFLDASTVGIISTLEPVIAIIVAFLALGETMTVIQALGGVAVVGAIVVLEKG